MIYVFEADAELTSVYALVDAESPQRARDTKLDVAFSPGEWDFLGPRSACATDIDGLLTYYG